MAARRSAACCSMAAVAVLGGVPVSAQSSGSAEIVSFGTRARPGVSVTARGYFSAKTPAVTTSPSGSSAAAPAAAPGAAPARTTSTAPTPVAISAHNCVPRLDPRGVSLSLEFSEGGGDCISFVSPPPDPAPRRGEGPRRRRPAVTPEQLALRAYERVISLAARPEIEIAPGEAGLTGLDSFFWTGNELRPVTATAGAGPLTVTAEARPVRYLWDFGDGTLEETTHPGRPWSRARPGDVAHLYETKGRYAVGLEVVWAARWRTNRGPWRDLGYFSTSSSEPYRVREMVAVLVRGR